MAQWDKVLQSRTVMDDNGLDEGNQSPAKPGDSQTTMGLADDQAQQYRFNGVAPPPHGRGSLKNPNQIVALEVSTAKASKDASGKEVIWFEVHVVSVQYEWSVWKRFSECVHFDDCMKRLALAKYKKALGRDYPAFPSKFHLGSGKGNDFVEKRRSKLSEYFNSIFDYLKDMHLGTLGIEDAEMGPPLSAAFNIFVDFIRSSSKSHGRHVAAQLTALGTTPETKTRSNLDETGSPPAIAYASPTASPNRMRFADSAAQHCDTPASKLILVPGVRFVIALFVPGIPVADVYVEMLPDEPHGVLVGGQWNSRVELLMQPDETHTGRDTLNSSIPSTTTTGSSPLKKGDGRSPSSPVDSGTTLVDTLPSGGFEMVFEVPPEFNRAHWYGEHAEGVLFLIWKQPAELTGRSQQS